MPLLLFFVFMAASGIAAVYLTVALHRRSDLAAASPVGPAGRTVIFVIDGAGAGDLSALATPHIADLEQHGVTYPRAWVGQMEDVGPSSNATIATGVFPRRHGVIGLQWRNPKSGVIERPTQLEQVQVGALDQVMQVSGSPSLAALLKQRDASARVLSVGASCANADAAGTWLADYVLCPIRRGRSWTPGGVTGHALPAGALAAANLSEAVATGRGAPAIDGWKVGALDDWLTRYTLVAMRRTRPTLTILNLPEIATLGPYVTPSRRQPMIRAVMAGVDRDIGKVVSELRHEGQANRTVYVVTSDQAMTPVTARLPLSDITRAISAAGGRRVYVDPGEATMIGLQDPLQAQPVAQAVQNEHLRGIDGLYYKQQSGSRWSYQAQYVDPDLPTSFARVILYELGTMASAASPDAVVIASPGAAFTRGRATETGLGAQWDTQHIPLIIAGHGVVPGYSSRYPARLVDVAPTLAALMWLPPLGGDGLILADAMAQPPGRASESQRAMGRKFELPLKGLRSRGSISG